ncbi:MAG: lamin tail domain-containing protein [Lentimicrobium sp.]|nr:lamin tail domain-containing protein [Lentimicrobium sp.]
MTKTSKTIRFSGVFIALVLVLFAGKTYSQSTRDLRINEILVVNDSNYVDDYGQHSGWIEIFNSAYNTVDIGGSYLTNDPANPTKYYIPKGDPITQIPPRNYLVFYADNFPTRGILHLNFSLTETNYLAIYEGNGKNLIDAIKFGPQSPDVSFGRLTDGYHEWGFLEKTTPLANNYTGEVISAGEKFVEMDPYGVGMAVIAMSVVFAALILLYIVFKNTKRIYSIDFKKLLRRDSGKVAVIEKATEIEISGEVNAAIAMAIHLYISELHDHEEAVLTIRKVSRTYSPWSSKIYGLRNQPR